MSTIASRLSPYIDSIRGLQSVGNQFWSRGWSRGTSSNYSVVVNTNPLTILVTASGKDKGNLGPNDFVLVDTNGNPIEPDQPKSSAETLLHCAAAKHHGAGAVLHTHSVWSTILSQQFFELKGIRIEGYEMLKGLSGITTHESNYWLPIFDNTQHIPDLQSQVIEYRDKHPDDIFCGYLIRKHGLYAWGKDLAEATRHVEILEFLLECIGLVSRRSPPM